MKAIIFNIHRICTLSLLLLSFTATVSSAMQVTFMGRLANFDGVIPSLWSKIAVDRERSEVLTLNPRHRDVRIFNYAGMEIFSFGENVQIAGASDIDLGENGNIYLVYPRLPDYKLLRLDYKGDPLAYINLNGVPEEYQPFQPERIQYVDGRLYLADTGALNIIVTDAEGKYQQGYHLKDALLALKEQFSDRPGEEVFEDPEKFKFLDMSGFCVDTEGNIYFTISTLFAAFKLPVNGGEMKTFGAAGSGPGKFGVVAGITTDSQGSIYVTDRLRSVVMIFDKRFTFLTEFGFRGLLPHNLIVPDDVIVDDKNGLVYVAQAANRGVSVFRVTDN